MYSAAQLENFLRRRYGFVKRSQGKHGPELITRCPVCSKKKLSVNAKSGMYQCWHGCMSGHIDSLIGDVKLAKAEFVARKPPPPGFTSPGTLMSLSHLGQEHPAIQYLLRRGFDPRQLEEYYSICYCSVGKKFAGGLFDTTNTIIIPVFFNGEMIAWQSRLLYDPDKLDERACAGMGFKQDEDGDYVKPPKYFTMPGYDKGKMLWNVDNARRSQVVVICEGVFDAIRVGRCAVATFGKGVTDEQATSLNQYWPLNVVLLDPGDADAEMQKLKSKLPTAVVIDLKGYKDAGEAPQLEIWRQIDSTINNTKAMAEAGKTLDNYKFIV